MRLTYTKEQLCRIWLADAPIDRLNARMRLADALGGAQALYETFGERHRDTLGDNVYRALKARRDAGLEGLLSQLERYGAHALFLGSPQYPYLLSHIADPPDVLFVRGDMRAEEFAVAVIGMRAATRYGKAQSRRIARELAEVGVTVVSGLARGVDTAAHEGALDARGRTVAVLGCGIGRVYPEENKELADRIVASGGAIVSEFALDAPPQPYHFPYRNRVISGLSHATLVTEAREKSGSFSTVNHALNQGRTVFALPGEVDAPGSAIPLKMLHEGGVLCTCAQDILSEMRWTLQPVATQEESDMPDDPVLRALFYEEKTFEELMTETGLTSDALGAQLTILEMYGKLEKLPGRAYRLAR